MARVALVGVAGALILRAAWLGDDAYITLRTVDHWLSGRGLVWNAGERVQAYTHPLWMLLLTGALALTGEDFYTVIALGAGLSIATVALFARCLVRPGLAAVPILLAFCLSRAFVDYSTSGLEGPLTHLLLAGMLVVWLTGEPGRRSLVAMSVLTGLGVLNRMDTALLFAPPLLAAALAARRVGVRWAFVIAGLSLAPVAAWMAFSLVYYGNPLPNTALAKLGTGIPRGEKLARGWGYLTHGAWWCPVTAVAIASTPLTLRDPRARPVVAGVVAYLAYVVWIGGDFMAGRFFTAPLIASLAVLARVSPMGLLGVGASALVIGAGLLGPVPTILSDPPLVSPKQVICDDRGIADERLFYKRGTGLLTALEGDPMPRHQWAHHGRMLDPGVYVADAIGLRGFHADAEVYLVNRHGLTCPLLARLPSVHDPRARPGHFVRRLPCGYLDSLVTGEDHFVDREVAALYKALKKVHRGPLWCAQRWREIWRLNTGHYAIDRRSYRHPPERHRPPMADPAARRPHRR